MALKHNKKNKTLDLKSRVLTEKNAVGRWKRGEEKKRIENIKKEVKDKQRRGGLGGKNELKI